MARQTGHAYSITASLFFLAWVHYYRREPEACRRLCRECLDIANEQGFGLFSAWARVLDGWSLFETGKPIEGIVEIREGISVVNANRIGLCLDVFKGILAECLGRQGNLEEAISLLDEAAEDSDFVHFSEVQRIKARFVSPAQAETLLRTAVQWAQGRGARSFELRAARDLASLVRSAEARTALSELYASFTQGFDTIDLQECREVLEISQLP